MEDANAILLNLDDISCVMGIRRVPRRSSVKIELSKLTKDYTVVVGFYGENNDDFPHIERWLDGVGHHLELFDYNLIDSLTVMEKYPGSYNINCTRSVIENAINVRFAETFPVTSPISKDFKVYIIYAPYGHTMEKTIRSMDNGTKMAIVSSMNTWLDDTKSRLRDGNSVIIYVPITRRILDSIVDELVGVGIWKIAIRVVVVTCIPESILNEIDNPEVGKSFLEMDYLDNGIGGPNIFYYEYLP